MATMGWESFGVIIFDLGSLFQGQRRTAKLKNTSILHIKGLMDLGCDSNNQ